MTLNTSRLDRPYLALLKDGPRELQALQAVDAETKSQMLSLLELRLPNLEKRSDPSLALSQRLNALAKSLQQSCLGHPVLLDLVRYNSEWRTVDGQHPMSWVCGRVAYFGVVPIPVVGSPRRDDAPYRDACVHVTKKFDTPLAVRLDADDLDDPTYSAREVCKFMTSIGTDLPIIIADAGHLQHSNLENVAAKIVECVATIRAGIRIGRIYVLGTNVPQSGALFKPFNLYEVNRREILLHAQVRKLLPSVPAALGDYAVSPLPFDDDLMITKRPTVLTKIRYVTTDAVLYARGRDATDDAHRQLRDLVGLVLESGKFCGAQFSLGDRFFRQCANGDISSTIHQQLFADTVHHLTFLARESAQVRAFHS